MYSRALTFLNVKCAMECKSERTLVRTVVKKPKPAGKIVRKTKSSPTLFFSHTHLSTRLIALFS